MLNIYIYIVSKTNRVRSSVYAVLPRVKEVKEHVHLSGVLKATCMLECVHKNLRRPVSTQGSLEGRWGEEDFRYLLFSTLTELTSCL